MYKYTADIVRDKKSSVLGAVFEIDDKIEKSLDYREGYPDNYVKINVSVKLSKGMVDCLVYVMNGARIRMLPPHSYEEVVVNGAKQIKLPKSTSTLI